MFYHGEKYEMFEIRGEIFENRVFFVVAKITNILKFEIFEKIKIFEEKKVVENFRISKVSDCSFSMMKKYFPFRFFLHPGLYL